MPVYPQLSNGSVCQFPFEKCLQYRTIVNSAEDGSRIVLQDAFASAIRWTLHYNSLSDDELGIYQSFFETMQGRLQTFTFLDPAGNLLTWSEDFSQAAWQKPALLQIRTGTGDPVGTQRATTLVNSGPGDLTLSQTLALPGNSLCCFSLFVRSQAAAQIVLNRGSSSIAQDVSSSWQRVFLSTATSDGGDASIFGITIRAGQSVDVFGMQVEAQARPSTYVPVLDRGGVYPMTRFDSDSLAATKSAPNSNGFSVKLYSRLVL
jgi:hypothetical protein